MTLKLNGTNSEAAPAYAGDDADTGLQCGTNELKLVTGGTARATVDSSGNIGVGVTPSSWGGSRNAIQFDSAGAAYLCNDSTMGIASNFYFDGSNNKYLTTAAAAAIYVQNGNIHFDIAPSGTAGDNAGFNTRARIDDDGLKFNTDTAAANALSDYEEGTWTPTINFDLAFTGGAYVVNEGFYTKIGRLVHVSCELALSSKGSSTGQVNIAGLPFTPNSDDESRASGVVGYYQDVTGINFPIVILIEPNQTSFPLRDSGSASSSGISDSNLGNGFRFYFSITYMT